MSKSTEKETWDFDIKPSKGLGELKLKEVIYYKDLLLLFVKKDIITVYKQTVLGPIWFVVQPILTTLTLNVIFSVIADVPTGSIPSILFYLSGVIIFRTDKIPHTVYIIYCGLGIFLC